jgi:WD40 repeat protein
MTFEYMSTYILSVQFSPFRPCVFAASTSAGDILLFDLSRDRKRETKTIRNANQAATNIRFNQRQQDLLACSYSGCQVRIYQLSDQFVQPLEGEEHYLQDLIE